MTWIVARKVFVGYSAALSDIRVTFGDGRERDLVQKIHPVSRNLALGFAGSVRIGFAMVQRLSALLDDVPPGMAWDPSEVAKWWTADAREVFDESPEHERVHGCHLLLLGVHPSEGGPFPAPHLYRFKSPTFEPESPLEHDAILSIGSGSEVAHYIDFLRGLQAPGDGLMNLEAAMNGRGGVALGMAVVTTKMLQERPEPGISSHLHICIVRRDQVQIRPNDQRSIGESESTHFVMPKVARSMSELQAMLEIDGDSSASLTC